MSIRPCGHIAGNLDILSVGMHTRLKQAGEREVLVSWITDDGCVFMASASARAARAIETHAPDQVFQRYRKIPGFGRPEILEDLAEARLAFARRSLHAAQGDIAA